MRRITALLLSFIVLTSIVLLPAAANAAEGDQTVQDPYTDAASMTDEEFFGVWDSENNKWTKQSGKLNYEAIPELSEVLKYVKAGEYLDAKSELLYYMRNRPNLIKGQNVSSNYEIAELLYDGIIWNSGVSLGGTFTVNSEFKEYKIDVSSIIRRRGSYTFTIMQRYKAEQAAEIYAKESDYAPMLEVYYGGASKSYKAAKDTYVAADFPDSVHGSEPYMYCKESKDDDENNIFKNIYGPESKRAYIQFNVTGLDKEQTIDNAFIKVRARSLGEATSLIVWRHSSTLWKESTMCWNNSEQTILSFNDSEYDFKNIPDDECGFGDGLDSVFARFQWATTMSGCYVTSKNERYAEGLIKLLNAFLTSTRDNVGAYGSQDAAMRLNLFINIYNDLLQSEHMDPDTSTAFIKNFWQLAMFLTYPANYRADHNHGCFHTRGLMKATAYFPEFRTHDEWENLYLYRWNELASNLMANTDYREGTTGYAITVLNIFNNVIIDTEFYGVDIGDAFREYTRKLGEYIANICFPNGMNIMLGDSDATEGFAATANTVNLLNDKRIEYMIKNGESGKYPGYDSIYMGGRNKLAIMRSGWSRDDLMLAINAASADGRSHTHLDNLSFAMYAYGQYLIVDPGRNDYGDNEISNWLRLSTESHNTVMVDEQNQGLASGNVQLFYTNKFFDTYQGYDATVSPYKHVRNMIFVKPYFWIISDNISGANDSAAHKYDQHWHFLPEAGIKLDGDVLTTDFEDNADLKMINVENENVSGRIRQGYYSSSSTGTDEADYLTFTQTKEGNASFDTILFPVKKGSTNDCVAERVDIGVTPDAASSFKLNLKLDGKDYNSLVYTSHEAAPAYRKISDAYGFDGRQVYLEKTATGKLSTINISMGSVLDCDGKSIVSIGDNTGIEDMTVVYDSEAINLHSSSMTADKLAVTSIYADRDIKSVTLNGGQIPFYKNGDQIVFRSDYNKVNVADGSATLANDITTYGSFTVNGRSYTAALTYAAGTTLSGTGWDGTIPSPLAQAASIAPPGTLYTSIGYTNSTITANAPVKLTFPVTDANMVYVNKNKLNDLVTDANVTVQNDGTNITVTFPSQPYEIIFYKPEQSGGTTRPLGGGSGSGGSVVSNPQISPETEETGGSTPTAAEKFGDISDHWAKDAILDMADMGIVNGDGNKFHPDKIVTRAEFTAFVSRIDGVETAEYNGEFSDVSKDAWFANSVAAGVKTGIIIGEDGKFRPNDPITREEVCVILERLMKYLGIEYNAEDKAKAYADGNDVSGWALSGVNAMLTQGILGGIDESHIAPKENTTRAMAVTILKRMIDKR